jgi:alpha-ketoglutarate-dependent 2,4-dichlorophenoxyacetate dioxygenase
MALTIRPIGACFAAEASGIDLREPLSDEDAAAIHAGMDEYAVLVFHGQVLTPEQQLAFSMKLGPLEEAFGYNLKRTEDYRLPTNFADVSNLDKDNKPFASDDRRRLFQIGNRLWHSDSSFKVVPAKYSILHAHSIPSKGGNTEFADMRAAYDSLDQDTKDLIEDLVCEHSQVYSRAKLGFTDFSPEELERFKPVRQRLVRTHPSTGRKSLYLASHIGSIVGWSAPEATLLLMDLTEIATQREFVYSHEWSVGDVVMWDNRATMHRGRDFPADEPRDVRRTTLMGDAPTVVQAV